MVHVSTGFHIFPQPNGRFAVLQDSCETFLTEMGLMELKGGAPLNKNPPGALQDKHLGEKRETGQMLDPVGLRCFALVGALR